MAPFSLISEGIDLTNVQRIEVSYIRVAPYCHFTHTFFGTVPEPSGSALVAIGLSGLGCLLRRRTTL